MNFTGINMRSFDKFTIKLVNWNTILELTVNDILVILKNIKMEYFNNYNIALYFCVHISISNIYCIKYYFKE